MFEFQCANALLFPHIFKVAQKPLTRAQSTITGSRMRKIIVLLASLVALSTGCDENLDPATPEGALHRLRDALLKKDTPTVLSCASAHTGELLAQLQIMLQDQRTTIVEKYPADQREVALISYPKGIFDAHDSTELFSLLTRATFDGYTNMEGLKSGMTVAGSITMSDSTHASIPVRSGEIIEFVLEDGKWMTTAFERQLTQNLQRLTVNQQTLEKNLTVLEELKRREQADAPNEGAAEADSK